MNPARGLPSAHSDGTLYVARQKGLEPLTRGLEGRCSVHLSYWRDRGEPI